MTEAKRGWNSNFVEFATTEPSRILEQLHRAYPEASPEEGASWGDSVPHLQRGLRQLVREDTNLAHCTAILEYQLPMESRRADAVLLLRNSVVVIEFKRKQFSSDADVDQAHAYARDLRGYHRECHNRPVHAILVLTRAHGRRRTDRNVDVCGPDALDAIVRDLDAGTGPPLDADRFLAADVYRPLPSLIRAARDLFRVGRPPQLWRAAANTDNAVNHIARIVADARLARARHLVLLAGVPGAGKTLVGMRIAHDPRLELLKEGEGDAPAVFLSGNGPLVKVLQYVLDEAGGDGGTFVRPVKEYVRYHLKPRKDLPHVVVFDEAQRAFDRAKMADVHHTDLDDSRSEPEHFIEFAERKRDWSVIVGLVGTGQEIYIGEEGGLGLWANAIRESRERGRWTVHAPPEMADCFHGLTCETSKALTLDQTLRSHRAGRLHAFVAKLIEKTPPKPAVLRRIANDLHGHDLRITRDRALADQYLRERYRDHADARFGLMASSRDKALVKCGVPNDFESTDAVSPGPWYNDGESDSEKSCRHLRDCVTEFGAQGLELDAVLLAWGTDFVLRGGEWVIDDAKGYWSKGNAKVRNPWQLRANAYRVLLTRGRDAHIVFVPQLPALDETWSYLRSCGFRRLEPDPQEPDPQEPDPQEPDPREPDPQEPPIGGWRPRQVGGGIWGAVLEGEGAANLPSNEELRGASIRVTDRKGHSWTTTITEVVDRASTRIVVKNSGRPRH